MDDHDQLCPQAHRVDIADHRPCRCDLIAAIRMDERSAALDAARDAVAALGMMPNRGMWDDAMSEALDAIDGLRNQSNDAGAGHYESV